MNIFAVGISHKTAGVEIREKLNISPSQVTQTLSRIMEQAGAAEGVLLSTCNRTEVYLYRGDAEKVKEALCACCGLDCEAFQSHLYLYEGSEAVTCLLRVASGLESLVMGEDEILRQVKLAHQTAAGAKLSGPVLNSLFKAAVTSAKKIKTETGLSAYAVSVGTIAVNAAKQSLGALRGKTALVIGSGEMGIIALKNLISAGMKSYVTIRTRSRVVDLSHLCPEAVSIPYDQRYQYLDACDVVLSCTGCPHFTLTAGEIRRHAKAGGKRVYIDLAVPRDIDEAVKELAGAVCFNIDDLQRTADENKKIRQEKALIAEEMIRSDTADFERWYEFRKGVHVLEKARAYAGKCAGQKIAGAERKLACSDDAPILEQAVNGAVDSLLETFLYRIRDVADKDEIPVYLKCIEALVSERND